MARILISGASGFIGRPLVSFFRSQGHSVFSLSRSRGDILWNPDEAQANPADFEGFDAVIHLAGESLSFSRWTAGKREKILSSRLLSTLLLSQMLTQVTQAPKVFIGASAIGFYGNRGDEILSEKDQKGKGFLSNVCFAWEEASQGLAAKGIRVVHARFGVVIGPGGGVLQKLIKPYQWGLGGKIGSGEQWISWIHLTDLVRSLFAVFENNSVEGPINLVAPNAVRQKEFAKILAEELHRPHFFNLPAWLLRSLFGCFAEEVLLASTRVKCAKLLASKFPFQYTDLRSAVHNGLQL